MQKIKTFLALLTLSLLVVSAAFAADPGGATVTNSGSVGSYGAPAAGSSSVTSGQIYTANLSTEQATYRWAGLFGNVSGNIVLGDSDDDVLYQWAASGNLVYASTAAAPVWASLADATDAQMPAYLTTGSDNYTATFTGGSESIGSGIFTVSSDFATTQTAAATTWKTYSLWDTTDLIFAGKVEEDGSAYDGSSADYQMIIPEDGTAGNAVATSYNLWVELQ
jgi:hypothetical protein